jgi:transcriptional regulator with XRE-family HTH domain
MSRETEHPGWSLFAGEMKAARLAAGWSREDLATRLNYSVSLVSLVENTNRGPTPEFAERLDEVFGSSDRGTFVRLQRNARSQLPSWFQPWALQEQNARRIRSWQGAVVDGLLQVRSYATALLSVQLGSTEDVVEQQVITRMARQEVLSRPDPPVISVILDEVVLRRPVGGAAVMREQVEHLISLSDSRNIVVQVVPLVVGSHTGLDGSFAIAEFPDTPSLGYAETALTGIVVDQREQVAILENRLDGLRAEALPRAASVQFMKDVIKEWI